ncbi:MAG: hypothetical protein IT435_09525 [Phycisphaerales bacterium]|nr:hypothetical protein [Phycisphaerales bacterium]
MAAGKMNHEILEMVQNLAGHLRNAQAGQIGDYKLPEGINLRRTSALNAFVFAIGKLWAKGKYSATEVRRTLDPKRVKNTAATPENILLDVTREVAHAPISRLVPLQEWWDIGLACVLLLDPDFDSKRACRTRIAPWRGSEGAYDREAMLQIWYETDNRYSLDGLWAWAERCELYLTQAAKTGQRPRRVASGQEPPAHSGGSTQTPMSQDKGSLTLKADSSKPVDPEDLNRVTVDMVSQRILWRDQTCHFVGKTQWQLVTLLNTNLGTPLNDETIRQRLWPGLKRGRTSVASLVNDVRNRLKKRGIPRSVISANRGWYHLNLVAE